MHDNFTHLPHSNCTHTHTKKNTYFEVVLIRLLNDVCVEFRISKPVPPAVDGGTTVMGNDAGSQIILSIESGSSAMPERIRYVSFFSSHCKWTSSLGDCDTCFLVNSEKDFKSFECLCKTIFTN